MSSDDSDGPTHHQQQNSSFEEFFVEMFWCTPMGVLDDSGLHWWCTTVTYIHARQPSTTQYTRIMRLLPHPIQIFDAQRKELGEKNKHNGDCSKNNKRTHHVVLLASRTTIIIRVTTTTPLDSHSHMSVRRGYLSSLFGFGLFEQYYQEVYNNPFQVSIETFRCINQQDPRRDIPPLFLSHKHTQTHAQKLELYNTV